MADQPKEHRNRRTNSKPNRQDIYCYDIGAQQDEASNSGQSQHQSQEQMPADDDSFSYVAPKIKLKKSESKKIKAKQKGLSPQPVKQKIKKEKAIKDDTGKDNGIEYVSVSTSKVKDLKIFNPVLHYENISLKNKYQKELQSIYEEFGKKITKIQQPSYPSNSWDYLLKQVKQVGADFSSERDERMKVKKKLAKYSQSFFNRKQVIKEQKTKQQQKATKRYALDLMRIVKRKFWGSCLKVRKIVNQQEQKKLQRQSKKRKLQDLVHRQHEASQEITKLLDGYEEVSLQNIQVSQTTKIPVIINVDKKPKYKYAGLHEDNLIRPSLLIKFPLREYQLLGVYWIYTLHNRGMNAILADEMGLGKTIQTIALLAHLAIQKGIWGPHLVIVPTTILMNWEIQFKRWCPAFKIMTYFGSPKQRKLKRKGWSKLNSFHVCITSYKIAVTDHPIFRRKKWYFMILDEAQNIKNFKSQRWQILLNFKTKNRLLLTGTPLQNDLAQLWSLLHFLMPKIFNSFDDFNEWFNIPFQQSLQKNFPLSGEILKQLHTILRPFFLRRLKKDVQTQLPTKSQSVIRCGMSRRQKYLYDEMIWHQNRKIKNNESSGGMMNVLMGLKKICNHPDLFQPRIQETPLTWVPLTIVIAHHMFLKLHFETYKTHVLRDFVDNFKIKFEEVAEDILNEYDKIQLTPENQRYYKNRYVDRLSFARLNYERSKRKNFEPYSFDLKKLQIVDVRSILKEKTISQRAKQFEPIFEKYLFVVPKVMVAPASLNTFPMNSQVQAEKNRLQYLRKKVKQMIPYQLEKIRAKFLLHFPTKSIILYDSGKLIQLVFLLRKIKFEGQKSLVFTQMTKMLDIFEKVLNMFKFNYVRLDGNTKTQLRQKIVERFNNDPRILCFISSTRSGGVGLNLTGASNVIFYDTDWNPAMDKQAQDRCHRIGQKLNVKIYRLITQHSIQENILLKSLQKRSLESLVTEDGNFDTSYFQKVNIKGLLQGAIDFERDQEGILADVEDQQDRQLLHVAQKQVKQRKQEEQQQLQVGMLPGLFRYGLNMLSNNDIVADKDNSQSEGVQVENNQSQEISDHEKIVEDSDEQKEKEMIEEEKEKEQEIEKGKRPRQKFQVKQRQQKVEIFEQSQQEEVQAEVQEQVQVQKKVSHQRRITTLEKLKAMAIYQSQFMFMKKHVYEAEEQKMEQEPIEQKIAMVEPKKKRRKRRN